MSTKDFGKIALSDAASARFWTRREVVWFLVATAIVLVSRLPFLSPGYGRAPDCWGSANIGRLIHDTGQYAISRFPGHPLFEIATALLAPGGAWAINGGSALMGTIAFVFFALILRRLGTALYLWTALALAFTPAFYQSSTETNNFAWGLGFLLASLYFVMDRRPLLAGLCLGLATGCRAYSVVYLALPLVLILYSRIRPGGRIKALGLMALVSAATIALCYYPVLHRFGLGLFAFYDVTPKFWPKVAQMASELCWGRLGCLALLGAGLLLLFRRRLFVGPSVLPSAARLEVAAWVAAILIGLGLFLLAPFKQEYLLPVLPFVLLLSARWSDRRVHLGLCGVLLVSSFLSFPLPYHGGAGGPGLDPQQRILAEATATAIRGGFRGPMLVEQQKLKKQIQEADAIAAAIRSCKQDAVVVLGARQSIVMIRLTEGWPNGVRMAELPSLAELDDREKSGHALIYLPWLHAKGESIIRARFVEGWPCQTTLVELLSAKDVDRYVKQGTQILYLPEISVCDGVDLANYGRPLNLSDPNVPKSLP